MHQATDTEGNAQGAAQGVWDEQGSLCVWCWVSYNNGWVNMHSRRTAGTPLGYVCLMKVYIFTGIKGAIQSKWNGQLKYTAQPVIWGMHTHTHTHTQSLCTQHATIMIFGAWKCVFHMVAVW